MQPATDQQRREQRPGQQREDRLVVKSERAPKRRLRKENPRQHRQTQKDKARVDQTKQQALQGQQWRQCLHPGAPGRTRRAPRRNRTQPGWRQQCSLRHRHQDRLERCKGHERIRTHPQQQVGHEQRCVRKGQSGSRKDPRQPGHRNRDRQHQQPQGAQLHRQTFKPENTDRKPDGSRQHMGKAEVRLACSDRQHQRNALNQQRSQYDPPLRQDCATRSGQGGALQRSRPGKPPGECIEKRGQSVQ